MSESLGLSIGVANLVATRAGGVPVIRSSVLTLFEHRASEIGVPSENPSLNEPGLIVRGFVERVGDRAPLVAADGTTYLGEALTVEALEALVRAVGYTTPVAVAVPAYWTEGQSTALRNEFFAQPGLAPNNVAPLMISDAAAAFAALNAKPGFPTGGVVALCDFGAGGTSVTLTNAGPQLAQIGQTLRYTYFSGDQIDQLIANQAQAGAPGSTPPARLLNASRRAKEQLSAATAATISTGSGADVPLSRLQLEQLISGPLDQFLSDLQEALQRNGIPSGSLAAVATAGGGASIPLLTTRLSERLQVPVFTTPQPALSAAIGAAILAQSSAGDVTTAGAVVQTPTERVRTSPPTAAQSAGTPATEAAPTSWPGQAADGTSGTYKPLAWSEDAAEAAEPVPYEGPEHTGGYGQEPAATEAAVDERYPVEPGSLPWYKRTALVLSVAGAAAAVLVAVLLALTLGHGNSGPTKTTTTLPPAQTVTVTESNGSTSKSVYQPPPTTTVEPTTTTSPPSTTTSQTTTTPSATTTSPSQTTSAPTTSSETRTFPSTQTRGPFDH